MRGRGSRRKQFKQLRRKVRISSVSGIVFLFSHFSVVFFKHLARDYYLPYYKKTVLVQMSTAFVRETGGNGWLIRRFS